jgi:hypothetical protein
VVEGRGVEDAWATQGEPGRAIAVARVLVTVQRPSDADRAVRGIAELAAAGPCDVQVVGVSDPLPLLAYWAPLAGTCISTIKAHAVEEAECIVRDAVGQCAPATRVTHRVCAGWRERWLVAALAAGEVDVLVLAGEPSRWQDRRAVLSAARAGGVRVVSCQTSH